MNQLEIIFVSAKTNMLHVVNLMEQIVWDGGYKSLSEEGIEKFKKAQSLINELYTEFQWKCTDMGIAGMKENKYGVPYHKYEIMLADGTSRIVDIGCEDDWGNIQEAYPDEVRDWEKSHVGWGNDADGHIEIVRVIDCETRDDVDPMNWARHFVWNWACKYSQ